MFTIFLINLSWQSIDLTARIHRKQPPMLTWTMLLSALNQGPSPPMIELPPYNYGSHSLSSVHLSLSLSLKDSLSSCFCSSSSSSSCCPTTGVDFWEGNTLRKKLRQTQNDPKERGSWSQKKKERTFSCRSFDFFALGRTGIGRLWKRRRIGVVLIEMLLMDKVFVDEREKGEEWEKER